MPPYRTIPSNEEPQLSVISYQLSASEGRYAP